VGGGLPPATAAPGGLPPGLGGRLPPAQFGGARSPAAKAAAQAPAPPRSSRRGRAAPPPAGQFSETGPQVALRRVLKCPDVGAARVGCCAVCGAQGGRGRGRPPFPQGPRPARLRGAGAPRSGRAGRPRAGAIRQGRCRRYCGSGSVVGARPRAPRRASARGGRLTSAAGRGRFYSGEARSASRPRRFAAGVRQTGGFPPGLPPALLGRRLRRPL